MKPHRYLYLYQPIAQFFRTLSPGMQTLLLLAKATLVLMLIGFQLAEINSLV